MLATEKVQQAPLLIWHSLQLLLLRMSQGMRFHSDPDQGTLWGNSTSVVSAGDTRTFVFRKATSKETRCVFALRHGDVVEMWGDCQHLYQHSVKEEAEAGLAQPRMSLVYKRTLATEGARRLEERVDWPIAHSTSGLIQSAWSCEWDLVQKRGLK